MHPVEYQRRGWSFSWGPLDSAGTRYGFGKTWGEFAFTGWVRLFGRGVQIKAPSAMEFFSERYGYKKPFVVIRGWRLFWLRKDG